MNRLIDYCSTTPDDAGIHGVIVRLQAVDGRGSGMPADQTMFVALANAMAAIAFLDRRSRDPRISRAEQLVAAIEADARREQLAQIRDDVRTARPQDR